MQFDKNNLESYNSAKCKGLIHSIFLTWSGIRNVEKSEITSLKFQCGEKISDPVRCKSKQFYELLISKKTMVSRGFAKLKDDFDLDDITVSEAFLNLKTVSSETFIRSFEFKFLDDIIYTNVRLAKIGYLPKNTCTFHRAECLLFSWHLLTVHEMS